MIFRYINTASTAGGDGTTNATTGANRAFASLSQAESTLYATPVSDDLTILCCGTAADSIVTIRELTTSVSYTITVEGNPNDVNGLHQGKWSTSHYRIEDNSSGDALSADTTSSSRIVIFKGIQVRQRAADGDCITFLGTSDGSKALNCLMWMNDNANNVGVRVTSNGIANIENCLIQKDTVKTYGHGAYLQSGAMRTLNTIIRGFRYGVVRDAGTSIVTNCLVFDNNDADFYGTNTIDYCASDDDTGTNTVLISNWDDQFADASYATSLDYRLSATSDLLGSGIGPTADANVPSTDIIGTARVGATCDVGPFETDHTTYVEHSGVLINPFALTHTMSSIQGNSGSFTRRARSRTMHYRQRFL